MLNVKKTKEMIIDFRITKNPMRLLEIIILLTSPLKPSALTSIWVSQLIINQTGMPMLMSYARN